MKKVYSYNPRTLEFESEKDARRSPLDKEDVFLIPAFSTDIKPSIVKGKITKFNKETKEWFLEDVPKTPEPKQPTASEIFAEKKRVLIMYRRQYLFLTDHHAFKKIDDPEYSYPVKVKQKRAAIRQEINIIEAAPTIVELSNYSETV